MYGTTYVEARSALEKGETSCKELVSSFLARIEERNSELNAFTRVESERALDTARRSDEGIAAGISRPLTGMVIGIKDVISRKNVPLSCASSILNGFEAVYSATCIERLESAGAILIGTTNCDEFAMGSSSESSCYGPVRHPGFPDRVPGGSSGGSAAAVAAGMCHVAIGSDTGGSIRQPAAFCGVVGIKPTYGRVSRFGLTAHASSFDTIGPLAGCIRDAALVLDTISGRDPRDATSIDTDGIVLDRDTDTSVRGLRIGVPVDYLPDGLDTSIRNAVWDAAKTLEAQGATILETTLPHTKYGVAAYYVLATAEASSNLARYDGVRYGKRAVPVDTERGADSAPYSYRDIYEMTRTMGFGDEVKRRIMLGTFVLSSGYYEAYYEKAARVRRRIRQEFDEAFKKLDVILTPATPSTAFGMGDKMRDPLQMYLSDVYTVTANLAGIPGLVVPFGCDAQNLPIGVQLLGAASRESTLLTAGYALEASRIMLPAS